MGILIPKLGYQSIIGFQKGQENPTQIGYMVKFFLGKVHQSAKWWPENLTPYHGHFLLKISSFDIFIRVFSLVYSVYRSFRIKLYPVCLAARANIQEIIEKKADVKSFRPPT